MYTYYIDPVILITQRWWRTSKHSNEISCSPTGDKFMIGWETVSFQRQS